MFYQGEAERIIDPPSHITFANLVLTLSWVASILLHNRNSYLAKLCLFHIYAFHIIGFKTGNYLAKLAAHEVMFLLGVRTAGHRS